MVTKKRKGRKWTEAQKEEARLRAWVENHRGLIAKLMEKEKLLQQNRQSQL